MSAVSKNKKYLELDGVRVSYRAKDNTIHITSVDEDLGGMPFHLTLGNRSESEQVLRDLLTEKGLIREREQPALIPESAVFDWGENFEAAGYFPLGVAANDKTVFWAPEKDSHMLIAGGTGQGKSVLLRDIFYHCMAHNKRWDFYGIDLKVVEFAPFKKYKNTVQRIASTFEEALEVILEVRTVLNSRLAQMSEEKVQSYSKLSGPKGKNILLAIDEANALLAMPVPKDADDVLVSQVEQIRHALIDLLRQGRDANIFVVVASQRPDATIITDSHKAYLETRVVAGRMDATPSTMVLRNSKAVTLPKIRGRGIISVRGEQKEFQIFMSQDEQAVEWIREYGTVLEPELYEQLNQH